ncbi:MAG: glycosyltransferase [Acidobacteria bacterium]|jgi:glycosyltransferase involved in cell wall biosynthesis|nr:glycosyltransferase [Acidobacteriota bacterium]
MTSPAALPAIVVISQCEWGLTWVFAHDLTRHFAAQGHPVVYLNPFPKRFPRLREWRRFLGRLLDRPGLAGFGDHPRPPAVRFITPLTLPDSNRFFTWFNRRWLLPPLKKKVIAACAGRRCLVFAFLPFATPVAFAAMLDPQRLVYARRDGYGDDPGLRHLDDREEELMGSADLVIASGPILAARSCIQLPDVLDIPGLVDFQAFFRPIGERRGPDPLCCFFGHVNERIDLPLLQRVGERYRLRLIGRISVDWTDEGNSERCGMVPHERVAELLAEADVVVIPYRLMGFTSSLFPYKIFEAFAQGKPVVATRLPALEPLERLLYLASSEAEFLEMIARAAAEGPEIKLERQELARQHDRRAVLESLRQRLLAAEGARRGARP